MLKEYVVPPVAAALFAHSAAAQQALLQEADRIRLGEAFHLADDVQDAVRATDGSLQFTRRVTLIR